jgi:6,7-dimethyl-8-ribityllumazine synthase
MRKPSQTKVSATGHDSTAALRLFARRHKPRIAIIRAEYNPGITAGLEAACSQELIDYGVPPKRIDVFHVPGCFEIPIAAQRLAKAGRHDVVIALGAVIKGDTFHFELVATECARGVTQVALQHSIPIIFEVLAVYKEEDAVLRAAGDRTNKGIEAAHSALAVLATLQQIRSIR